ncbi:uncharacterized protein N7487_008261 [Penicillium crustosum]|uniref:uncharacterized protein n=1 Tax=Penicillium crustosum TaxID=36656 RepID=UPI00239F2370|nr:uncharacterized protein N7487_008261 [Penicillium crustosum]KAJ5402365.1 hypothetical protein N7487_008261 [Penicillium crustosum]
MEAIEDDEPIFQLAVECESLFTEHISRLNDDDEPNGATMLSELNQRFAAWAAFLGVFAESKMSFDHRLRHHAEIQDQVLRLLDVMQRNLTYLFNPDHSPEPLEGQSSDVHQDLRVSISSLQAISGAIERLNHLEIAIRRSSVTGQTTKTRKFAETFDFTSFEQVAYISLRSLYTDANEGLLEQLTRCMTETYARFLLRKSRQERLQVPRAQPQSSKESLTCDWCFTPLPVDSLGAIKWRHHMDEDHEPYVCISEKCSESWPRFATSTQWFQHMLTTHGQSWHREVHVPSSWVCPLCTEGDASFSKPIDLTAHLRNFHEGTFTESQIQAIVRQSRFRFPRSQDMCPLCCLFITDQHAPFSKETDNGNRESSSKKPHTAKLRGSHEHNKPETGCAQSDQNSRDGLETTTKHQKPRTTVDPCSRNPVSVEVIASHIAAHLQGVMLLTLRLISIDVVMDGSGDDQSASGATNHRSSWVGSGKRYADQEISNMEDSSLQGDGDIEIDDIPPPEDIVPDSEYIDWHGVPRYFEASLDNLLLEAVTSGTDDTYDNFCKDIYMQIYMRLERRDNMKLRFLPRGSAQKTLHRGNMLRFFRSIILPKHTAMDQFQLAEEDFVKRIDERELYEFLAILIFASCNIKAARTFTTKLVAKDVWPVLGRSGRAISSLPAGREELMELFSDKVSTDQFITKQACLYPVVIRRGEEVQIQTTEEQHLPYLEEQLLERGAICGLYKVRIAKGHFYDAKTRSANLEAVEVVRKDHIIDRRFPAKRCHQLMEILAFSGRRCNNIIQVYGSLRVNSTCSLFMPLAICDLWTYMMEPTSRPYTTMQKADIISSAVGLTHGLDFLHNGMKSSNMICYHMNIRPRNILIFRGAQSGRTRYIWKLSDFYLSHVVTPHLGKGGKAGEGSNWSDDGELVLNRQVEGSYLGPESLSLTPSMTAKSDVWSLGCVISIVFAYLEGGGEGVTQYGETRSRHHASDGYSRFFVRGKGLTPFEINPEVTSWHTNLIDKAHQRDPREGEGAEFMLRYLENRVFEPTQAKRDGALGVGDHLYATFRRYSISTESPARSFRPDPRSRATGSLR